MEHSRFDRLARVLGNVQSRRTVVAVVGGGFAAPLIAGFGGSAKRRKRKKTCAKQCQNGCCTSKYGRCIELVQQSASRCGTGGGICQSSGCVECTPSRPCPAGQCCDGTGACGACTVFVTSTPRLAGDLGGLAGADATCQARAAAAGLPGRYMAWLSDTSASPATRFARATVSYTLPGGETVATSWNDLTSGDALGHEINQDENGEEITGSSLAAFMVWTNTLQNGSAGGSDPNGHCSRWTTADAAPTGNVGDARNDLTWTTNGFLQCVAEARLYCFQQR